MCTLVISRNLNSPWPVMIASNRDENISRRFLPPGKHWVNNPNIFAGYDKKEGGSWLGINNKNLLIALLNRPNQQLKKNFKTSRGQIVIEGLKQKNSIEAINRIKTIDINKWKPFNVIVADYKEAYWIKNDGLNPLEISTIPMGVSMIDSKDLNDLNSERFVKYYKKFCSSIPKGPDKACWKDWIEIMSKKSSFQEDPLLGITIDTNNKSFGTVCSSLISIPNPNLIQEKLQWQYCDGAPQFEKFKNILL